MKIFSIRKGYTFIHRSKGIKVQGLKESVQTTEIYTEKDVKKMLPNFPIFTFEDLAKLKVKVASYIFK